MKTASDPLYLHYTLTLESPAILTGPSGAPSNVRTQTFIPGSAIRGAVAARLIEGGRGAESEEFGTLVLSGAVCYLNAYPEIGGSRALPVPVSWRCIKGKRRLVDLGAGSGGEPDAEEDWPPCVPVGAPFMGPTVHGDKRHLWRPPTNSRFHQQRDRVKGRPWTERSGAQERAHGTIFSYEYLESGQLFRGVIQVMPEARRLVSLLKDAVCSSPLLLGRSRRAGYGGQGEIKWEPEWHDEHMHAVYGRCTGEEIGSGAYFRIMLTSPYIGRHPVTGQIDPTALEHEVVRLFNSKVQVKRRCWRFETVSGFNRKWRLDTPQALAVAAGSFLVLQAGEDPIKLKHLQQAEHVGLGERRTEGFGRILFMEHVKGRRLSVTAVTERVSPCTDMRLDSEPIAGQEQLSFLEKRIVLAAAEAKLERAASFMVRNASNQPANSLLSRIRTPFRQVRDERTAQQALSRLAVWCGNEHHERKNLDALKSTARTQLMGCSLTGVEATLFEWLRNLSASHAFSERDRWKRLASSVGDWISLDSLHEQYLTGRTSVKHILCAHSAWLTAYLIDSVLAGITLKNRGETGEYTDAITK